MRSKRSTNVLLIGVAVFIIGAGVAFAGLRTTPATNTKQAAPAVKASAAPAQPQIVVQQAGAAVAITIPKGKQAVAVDLPSVAGLAGYAKPGDTVNVYATVKNATDSKVVVPQVKLVLRSVKVLDVRVPAQGAAGNNVYLLALDQNEAERLIFFGKFESLWFTLVPPGQVTGATAGHTYRNAL